MYDILVEVGQFKRFALVRLIHFKRIFRSSPSEVFLKLKSNFFEIALRHGCSPANLLHIFRTHYSKNASEGLLLEI